MRALFLPLLLAWTLSSWGQVKGPDLDRALPPAQAEARQGEPANPLLSDPYLEAMATLSAGDPEQAIARLWAVVRANPLHAGAWLDLAILYCDAGQADAAYRLFDHIETRFAPSAGIRDLIHHYRASECPGPASLASGWTLGLHAGYDSNANLGPVASAIPLRLGGSDVTLNLSPQNLPRSDHWLGLNLYSPTVQRDGWSGNLALGYRQYATERAYDQLRAYGQAGTYTGPVHHILFLDHLQLGGKPSFTTLGLRSRLPQLPQFPDSEGGKPFPLMTELAAAVSAYHVGGQPVSSQWEPRVGYPFIDRPGQRLEAWAGLLADLSAGNRPGGRRFGPTAQLDYHGYPAPGWQFDASLHTRWLHDQEVYSPLFGDEKRRQHLSIATASLGYLVAPRTRCQLSGKYIDSDDNLPLLAYRQWLVSFGCDTAIGR